MGITQNEKETMIKITEKIKEINDFFRENGTVPPNSSASDMYLYMVKLKRIMGNFDNDMSYIGCQMAKEYLCKQHEFEIFDVSLKPQSAPGLDIDEMTVRNERVVGEIKTTYPYGKFDFGAQQKVSFRKDFKKLQDAQADFKYLFVTENRTYDIIITKYMDELNGVKVVLLPQALDSDIEPIETQELRKNPEVNDSPLARQEKLRLADDIRDYILSTVFKTAREHQVDEITIVSGDVHAAMKLKNRYAAVCSVMEGKKIEEKGKVRIVMKEGKYGANYRVRYKLNDNR